MATLHLGDTVPNFKAKTTKGPIQFHEWKGSSWAVILSHPADFTPVCTTELGRLAILYPEFERRNVKLLAHSVDHLKSHVDWLDDIKSYCKDIRENFPYAIISDPNREIAVLLNMIDTSQKDNKDKASTVRACYVVDPHNILRMSIHYPHTTGRNIEEILRVIDSLQLVEAVPEVVTPANWSPGERVMIDPSVSDEQAEKLFPGLIEKVSLPSGIDYIRTAQYNK